MGNNMKNILVLILASTFSLTACGNFLGSKNIAEGTQSPDKDYDTVNGSITVGANSAVGDLSTVNGSIKISSGTSVGSAETVNGSINFTDGVKAQSAETVNGSIRLGTNCEVEEDVETVNGSIIAESGCEVEGNYETVNGKLKAINTEIHGNVKAVNGKILLLDGTHVHDDVIIEKSKGFFNSTKSKKPVVVLGKDVVVDGDLIFEKPVKLYIHDTAKYDDDFENAEVIKYSGSEEPY